MITAAEILERAAKLQKQAERLRSDLDATLGAIQDCGYWLEVLKVQQSGSEEIKQDQ